MHAVVKYALIPDRGNFCWNLNVNQLKWTVDFGLIYPQAYGRPEETLIRYLKNIVFQTAMETTSDIDWPRTQIESLLLL